MPPAIRVNLSRSLTLPDPLRLARHAKSREVGPRVFFFSGGSAINPLCRELIRYTHNSIHVITTFDSGGSSAVLRKAFHMPAVGDVRNRLMALADDSVQGNPDIVSLFAHRLPTQAPIEDLRGQLADMVAGRHPLVAAVSDPMRKIIRNHLRHLSEALPADFDLKGASVGNMVLTGGYLNNNRHLDPVVFMFSKLAEVRGVVQPVVNADLQLAARLADGSLLVGQHLLTGRVAPPISSPVRELFLCKSAQEPEPVEVAVRDKVLRLLEQAELICYPMGSFYSSLVANLLPQRVCQAVAQAQCPKVYIPNPAGDPEQLGMSLADSVATLLGYLRAGCGGPAPAGRLISLVLVDSQASYPGGPVDLAAISRLGVEVLDVPLGWSAQTGKYDPKRVADLLLSLV